MNPNAKTRSIDTRKPDTAPTWLPAERLGQLQVEPRMCSWLIGKGLISQRMKEACGERFRVAAGRAVERPSVARAQDRLKIADSAALFRDVELCCADQTWVFVQSVIPDHTLCVHPWLAELERLLVERALVDAVRRRAQLL